MKYSRTRSRGRRRFYGTLAAASLVAVLGAPNAFAGIDLTADVSAAAPAVDQVTETVSQTVSETGIADQLPAVDPPATPSPEPLPAVSLPETTAGAVAAVGEVTNGVLEVATSASKGRVAEAAQATLDLAAPVLDAASTAAEPAATRAEPPVATAGSDGGTTEASSKAAAAPVNTKSATPAVRETADVSRQSPIATTPASRPAARVATPAADAPLAAPTLSSEPVPAPVIPSSSADDSQTPAPSTPAELFRGLLPAASGVGGSFAAVLATLAALLIVAAPGLGRWLRPRLVSWPQPILDLSLERPG